MTPRSPADILDDLGPLTSSALLAQMTVAIGSPDAARKRLERSVHKGEVRHVVGLKLPHNERFYYLESQHRSNPYFSALLKAFDETGSAFGLAVASLAARGGVTPAAQFALLSGSPSKLKGHIPAEAILEGHLAHGVMIQTNDPSLGNLIQFAARAPRSVHPLATVRARLIAEDLLLSALKDWLRKNNFASYNMVTTRPPLGVAESPDFAHLRWDLTAPSYLHPLVARSSGKTIPGFVVADTMLANIDKSSLRYFINKCNLLVAQRGVRPTINILVAEQFESEAFNLGRSRGILLTTPSNLFGTELGAALRDLIAVLSNAAAAVASDPARIDRIVSALSRIEGAAANLRGPLLELIVGMLVKDQGGTIDMGKKIRVNHSGLTAEIDILRVKDAEIWTYECKAKSMDTDVGPIEIKDWLERQLPRIADWVKGEERFSGKQLNCAFWTTGRFSADALDLLASAQKRTKQYKIEWKDGTNLYQVAERQNHQYGKKLLNEHFRQPPI